MQYGSTEFMAHIIIGIGQAAVELHTENAPASDVPKLVGTANWYSNQSRVDVASRPALVMVRLLLSSPRAVNHSIPPTWTLPSAPCVQCSALDTMLVNWVAEAHDLVTETDPAWLVNTSPIRKIRNIYFIAALTTVTYLEFSSGVHLYPFKIDIELTISYFTPMCPLHNVSFEHEFVSISVNNSQNFSNGNRQKTL